MEPGDLVEDKDAATAHDKNPAPWFTFAGQLLVGEMNRSRIVRVMLDEVAGELQGACVPFYDDAGLTRGSHRFVFGSDGSLWVGQTHLSWVGGEGVQRIRWNGKTPMDVQSMKLIPGGFQITFTKRLAKSTHVPDQFKFKRYYYEYRQGYGSPQNGTEAIKVAGSKRLGDEKTMMVYLDKMTWSENNFHKQHDKTQHSFNQSP